MLVNIEFIKIYDCSGMPNYIDNGTLEIVSIF